MGKVLASILSLVLHTWHDGTGFASRRNPWKVILCSNRNAELKDWPNLSSSCKVWSSMEFVASLGIHYPVQILGPDASTGHFCPSGYLVGGEGRSDIPCLYSGHDTAPSCERGGTPWNSLVDHFSSMPGDDIPFCFEWPPLYQDYRISYCRRPWASHPLWLCQETEGCMDFIWEQALSQCGLAMQSKKWVVEREVLRRGQENLGILSHRQWPLFFCKNRNRKTTLTLWWHPDNPSGSVQLQWELLEVPVIPETLHFAYVLNWYKKAVLSRDLSLLLDVLLYYA